MIINDVVIFIGGERMVSLYFRNLFFKLGFLEERLEVFEGKGVLVEDEFEGIRYVCFRDLVRNFRRGIVVFEIGEVVFGFLYIKCVV